MSFKSELRTVMDSGKIKIGLSVAMKSIKEKKARLIIVTENCPAKEELFELAKENGVSVLEFEGSSVEAGSVCGKPFPASAVTIIDPGESSILQFKGKVK
jgi:large subunit ribosomal protein L30e